MKSIQEIIFPTILLGGLVILLAITLIANQGQTETVQAAVEEMPAHLQNGQSCSFSANYPASIQAWCGQIEKYAQKHGVDPRLVAAVMLQESGGDPQAYSHSGAVGLLQVMPSDGLAAAFMCANGPCFANRPAMEKLFDPEFNIAYGTRMLASLYERYGDWREALRAYGPADVGYSYADKVLSIYAGY
jgi:soluble lytic murein transglycosylase-like protein